jgi:hypothetical protein
MPLLKESWLENELKSAKILPLVVIDYKVYAHQIHGFTESALEIVGEDEEALRKVVRALWAYRLNRGIDSLPPHDFTALVADDFKGEFGEGQKGYWRHIEAEKLGMPEYKGGRPDKPSLFPIILEEGYKYIKSPGSTFHFFEKKYYEADDIAGKIARIQRDSPPIDRYILLSTLDGDWQGLVSDKDNIVWCNTGPWLPRIRTEEEVCDYYLRKEKLKISTARETYTVKVEVGDRGDNLMPGTQLRFFDLYDEDPVWGWTEDEVSTLTRIMSDTRRSNRPDHLEKSKKFLQSLGMFLPEIPAPTQTEIVIFSEKAVKERREALHPELKGLNKKYCMKLSDPEDFTKCAKIVADDRAALEKIKELETLKKEGRGNIDPALIKELKQSRQDYKATLLRFDAQAKKE